jgi:feruloyl esterase
MELLPSSLVALLALGLSLSAPVLASTCTPRADFQTRCASITTAELGIPDATVWFSQYVPAGTNVTFPDRHPTCGPASLVASSELCRIALYIATSNRSGLSLEAWLPVKWNSRFLTTGNGGLNGCVSYADIDYAASFGFGTVGANNGHNGTGGAPFLNNDDIIIDYAWRSVHTSAVVGKQIVQKFYQKPFTKSYYLGCSTGGRQGFKSVQDFPEDFDGVVAGAPAFKFNDLQSWSGRFYSITGPPGSESYLSPALWNSVHADVLKQCDELDGYKDGILEDPSLCNYRPESIMCSAGQDQNSTGCLTPRQAQTVREVFSPVYDLNGNFRYPRMQPGAEVGASTALLGGTPFVYAGDWLQYVVYNDTNFDTSKMNLKDFAAMVALDAGGVQTWNGDLSKFRNRGGKVLHYHGLMDPLITSDISPIYYDFVSRTMGLQSSELDSFYRFFRISGLGHCAGGPGASFIGQRGGSFANADPQENVLMAMVEWVEKGRAPDSITGTAYVPGTASGTNPGQVAFKRKHCKYPGRNVYSGKGDPTSPDSWHCI